MQCLSGRGRQLCGCSVPQKICTRSILQKSLPRAHRGLLGIDKLEELGDIDIWVEGVLSHCQQHGDRSTLHAACSSLAFIQACHPDSRWQAAAAAALQQVASTVVHAETAAAAAAAAAAANELPPPPDTATVRQLVQHVAQLDDWVSQLKDLQSATTAAAAAIAQDPACAPVLLLNAAAAQQHPIWARDFGAFMASSPAVPAAAAPPAPVPATVQTGTPAAAAALPFLLPAEGELVLCGGASLNLRHSYTSAAANISGAIPNSSSTSTSTSSSFETGTSQDSTHSQPASTMPWPLTAGATKLLLSSPLGLLPEGWLGQVHSLGVVGRCRALADAVDLGRLVGAELTAAQAEQWQLGQQLRQHLVQLHTAVQAGVAVDPVLLAAAASAAAAADTPAVPAGASPADTSAEGDPWDAAAAVESRPGAVQFLQDLAAFGKSAAAEELQSWLDLCRQDPALRSYLLASGGLQQLPTDLSALQPHQLDALRETVAVAQANKGGAGSGQSSTAGSRLVQGAGVGDGVAGAGHNKGKEHSGTSSDSWLQEYTELDVLLPGICSVLGDCLQLELVCCPAAPGTSWCQEAYLITATDKQAAQRSSSSSSSSQQAVRGHIWLLFDQSYQGMPVTHVVSPGLAPEQRQPSSAGAASTPLSQQQQQQRSVPGLLGSLQATTVAVVFPSTFCSANRGPHGSSNHSPDSSSGSSAFGLLQSLLHELGHAMHFLLSASGSPDPAVAGGHRASLEVMEIASHLTDRMARNATCLQAMLRHKETLQPPHPALIQQLLSYNSISSRGVHQWHQQVLAALTDSLLAEQSTSAAAAAAAEDGSSARCWDVLQRVTRRYSPLAAVQQNGMCSSALLSCLAALVVLQPGDLYCYVVADLLAAALWGKYLQGDALDPAGWSALLSGLFSRDARAGTAGTVEGLLGPGSMQQMQGGGWVPNLEHPCCQDIDLWL